MGLILSKEIDVASFSDDSSPDARQTGRSRVAIYGTVVPTAPLDWFFALRSHYPGIPGELKGSQVVQDFATFPTDLQEKALDGMRAVMITVSDPRPQQEDADQIWESVWGPRMPSLEELRYRARGGDPVATHLLESREQYVARSLLLTTPYQRMIHHLFVANVIMPVDSSGETTGLRWIQAELQALERGRKSLTAMATEYAARMGPAFGMAEEEAVGTWLSTTAQARYSLGGAYAEGLARALRRLHKYDEGDEKLHGLLNERWQDLTRAADDAAYPYGRPWTPPETPLGTFDSADSVFGQAADVAARFAALCYQRGGLVELVQRFAHVTFNGERVGLEQASELLRRWKCLRLEID